MRVVPPLRRQGALVTAIALGFLGLAAAPAAARPLDAFPPTPLVTPAPLPQQFDTAPAPAILAGNEASACPLPAQPGQMQCMSLFRTDVQGGLGIQAAATVSGYAPASLQSAYNLTSASATGGVSGTTPETVAVVDAYDDTTAAADLATYRSQWGLPACDASTGVGCVIKVNEMNQRSPLPAAPSPANGDWTWEESADLDMVSAICPNCRILLIEGNSASVADLGEAELSAELDTSFIANSWGSPEFAGESADDNLYFNAPGKAIVFAAGDAGYRTAWPAASQFVTSAGGTSLTQASGTSRGWTETAWNGTGSGCATAGPKPSWQTADDSSPGGCLNRTASDVAAVAAPSTGVAVYDSTAFSGTATRSAGWGVGGGTSVASSIIASVYALTGFPAAGTYPASYLYQSGHAADFNDVTSGSNGTCETNRAYLCAAGTGYDGPTGWGTPDNITGFASSAAGDLVTIADPGVQDYETGASVSLPIGATDSAAGQTLTYTATGLPAGLTINSGTGLISGTLSGAAGTAAVTVTASEPAGTGSVKFSIVTVPSLRTGYVAVSGPVHLNLGGKCLDNTGGSSTNGNKIQIYACNGLTTQDWTYQPDGSPGGAGTLTINGKCADITSNGTANGSKIQLWSCLGGANQQWAIEPGGELVSPVSGRCLDDPGSSTTNGTQVDIHDCTGAASQQWTLPASSVQSGVSGKCMDDTGGGSGNGNVIQVYACNGDAASQRWTVEPGGTLQIEGKCLDVTGASKLDGALLQLWSCTGATNQKWVIGPRGQLENLSSGKCLDDPGNTTINGTQLIQDDCYGQAGEIWAAT